MKEAIANPDCGWFYRCDASSFSAIPGTPIAYWAGNGLFKSFKQGDSISQYGRTSKGIITGENDLFYRLWWEICDSSINKQINDYSQLSNVSEDWFPLNKGGQFRRWYGNNDYVICWKEDGDNIFCKAKDNGHHAQDYDSDLKFKPCISWSIITSDRPSFRYRVADLADQAGTTFYPESTDIAYFLGFLNTSIAYAFFSLLSPTMNMSIGDFEKIPIKVGLETNEEISDLTYCCLSISKDDFNSFETSWDFQRHPMV